jgi:hypothetical protein
MGRLFLVLFSMFFSSIAAHATSIRDLGPIPIGETREISILFPSSTYTTTPESLDRCLTTFVIVRCETYDRTSYQSDLGIFSDSGAFKFITGDCGPEPGNCMGFSVTSRAEDLDNGGFVGILFYYWFETWGYDVNGQGWYFGGNDGSSYVSGIRYTPVTGTPSPVPVPAALPLLAAGLAALGVMRKHRKSA